MKDAATPMFFGSREVERFLVSFLGISNDGASNFSGRLKHLIRQKFPVGVDTGRGVPARYFSDQFFQVVVVVELWQWGVPPARAIKLVTDAWSELRSSIRAVWQTVDAGERGEVVDLEPIFWRVPVEALDYLIDQDRPWRSADADRLLVLTSEQKKNAEAQAGKFDWRIPYIEADKFLKAAFESLKYGGLGLPPAKIAAFMSTMAEGVGNERAP